MKHINKTATQYKMTTNGSHRELQRNFSSQTVIQHWNKLPQDVINAKTVNSLNNWLSKVRQLKFFLGSMPDIYKYKY